VIKSKKKKSDWRGILYLWGRYVHRVLVGRPEGKNYLKDPHVDGRLLSKWIFKKWDGAWTGLIWLRIGTGGGLL
jgi:hypothetical protein